MTIADIACRHDHGRGRTERSTHRAVVFVRRGCFVRTADGSEVLLDPMVAYCVNPGQEERYDHPRSEGDDCTAVSLEAPLAASLWGGDPSLPSEPLQTSPDLDLQQRLLVAASRAGVDPHHLTEHAILLASRVLELADPRRAEHGRPATERARRAAVDAVREALSADPDRSLPGLAREAAISPHHLSRVFRAMTGQTVAGYRVRLRARAALERLAGGERSLARLAADLGFADQSHLCRVLRRETDRTPSALRAQITDLVAPGRCATTCARGRA